MLTSHSPQNRGGGTVLFIKTEFVCISSLRIVQQYKLGEQRMKRTGMFVKFCCGVCYDLSAGGDSLEDHCIIRRDS